MRFLILAAAVLLAGCATQRVVDPALKAAADEPLFCQGAEQCGNYWKRAQVWVATNSRWKIQNATDSVITTFTPVRSAVEPGFQITRLPVAGGLEQIKIASACANMFGCDPGQDSAAAAFKAFVRAADSQPVRNVR